MNLEAIKRLHDAAVELGARCHQDGGCFFDTGNYYTYSASFTAARAKAWLLSMMN